LPSGRRISRVETVEMLEEVTGSLADGRTWLLLDGTFQGADRRSSSRFPTC
jgi:hypothetical protein